MVADSTGHVLLGYRRLINLNISKADGFGCPPFLFIRGAEGSGSSGGGSDGSYSINIYMSIDSGGAGFRLSGPHFRLVPGGAATRQRV